MSTTLAPVSPTDARHGSSRAGSALTAIAIIVVIVLLDQWTKHLAVTHLVPRHMPHEIIGDVVRFTLTFNPGAAFGMHLGDASRWVFTLLTLLILGFLVRLFTGTPRHDTALRLAVATVMGGALGNLVDRLRSASGVVDFIDIGVGDVRFWTFNVADTAVSLGAVALVILLWRRDLHASRAAAPTELSPDERLARESSEP
ncbi:Lipoprotein signal peptidase [Gemmatirosa kalamazoonensis]|uniref:Lipoprotein signal peptidase n=1 Tax=Gemmatirosa kalamazoonensis TaxID=861299 RepID=W0RMB8_9BACT|nr:signal peptidase II [Gemmatirosa kalamazoonensis]AHG90588.1 Lipoprotein signal peptidase [Gemmatirosa kalamazoonensis]